MTASSTASRCFFGSFFTGTESEKRRERARSSRIRKGPLPAPRSPPVFASGRIAPSRMDRFRFGMTSPGSNSSVTPSPEQCGQAPSGLLNENELGTKSGKLTPHASQRKRFLYECSVSLERSVIDPDPSRSDVSSESRMRSLSGRAASSTSRSTTTSILSGSEPEPMAASASASDTTSPSMRTRTYPHSETNARRAEALFPWNESGSARKTSEVSSGKSRISPRISCDVFFERGFRQDVQCGTPSFAKSNRR